MVVLIVSRCPFVDLGAVDGLSVCCPGGGRVDRVKVGAGAVDSEAFAALALFP